MSISCRYVGLLSSMMEVDDTSLKTSKTEEITTWWLEGDRESVVVGQKEGKGRGVLIKSVRGLDLGFFYALKGGQHVPAVTLNFDLRPL